MRKNILFNTTRQWNPGDQFIMMGVQYLMRWIEYNAIIFNRHPAIWGKGWDNSFKIDTIHHKETDTRGPRHDARNIDYYIAAGTPEWDSTGIFPLFRELIKAGVRSSWIGVGCGCRLSNEIKELFKKADVITGRDQGAYNLIKEAGGVMLPCPAFYSSGPPRVRKNSDSPVVGLVYMSDLTGANRIHPKTKPVLQQRYREAIKEFPNAVIICHYIDEALEARKAFPGTEVYYSYDAKDFPAFYDKCDITVGPRLHGAVMGAGVGAPGLIILDQNSRDQGRRKWGSEPYGIPQYNEASQSLVKVIKEFDIEKESRRLIYLKYLTEIKYSRMMVNKMRTLFNESHPDCESFLGGIPFYAPKATIPAAYSNDYYQFYRLVGQQEKPKEIFEIGTRYGYTLLSMILGSGIDNVQKIVSIDKQSYGSCYDKPSQEIAAANIRSKGYKGDAKFYVDSSVNVRKYVNENRQFDIVHVDGDHSYTGAKRDILNTWCNVKPGGVMLVDDIDDKNVWRAVEDAIDELNIIDVDFMGSKHGLIILRKDK